MSEPFVHKVILNGEYPKKDQTLALAALVAETIAVYYWSESFAEGKPTRLCIVGQRGLAEYAAKASVAVISLIGVQAERIQETLGFKFGTVIALREALRHRRDGEQRKPEYMDQCNVSTYRAKRSIDKHYKVGVKDIAATFDMDGYQRGLKQIWTLKSFKTPIQVLDTYARSAHARPSGDDDNAGS